jgi:succinate-semialdehyde dehydrogenase / glutarate-semialdehyde dehydrogenase
MNSTVWKAQRAEFRAINPSTGELVKAYQGHSRQEVDAILQTVSSAYRPWRSTDFETRANLMRQAAEVLRRRGAEFSELMAAEMGKPLKDGRAEIDKCAIGCDYFADNAARFLQPKNMQIEGAKAFVTFNPLGVVLALMPWNFPFWQVFRFAAPTLMAGNVAVLKHANNVPGSALAMESIFREAGFPEGVFRTLMIDIPAITGVIQALGLRPSVSLVASLQVRQWLSKPAKCSRNASSSSVAAMPMSSSKTLTWRKRQQCALSVA